MVDIKPRNPFDLAYTGLFNLLNDFEPFSRNFKRGCLIRYDGPSPRPQKQHHASADMPECELRPLGGAHQIHSTSSTNKPSKRYDILLSTGSWQIEVINQIEWTMLQALHHWNMATGPTTNLSGITWQGQPFINNLTWLDAQQGQASDSENKNIEGWALQAQIELEFNFTNTVLRKI